MEQNPLWEKRVDKIVFRKGCLAQSLLRRKVEGVAGFLFLLSPKRLEGPGVLAVLLKTRKKMKEESPVKP